MRTFLPLQTARCLVRSEPENLFEEPDASELFVPQDLGEALQQPQLPVPEYNEPGNDTEEKM